MGCLKAGVRAGSKGYFRGGSGEQECGEGINPLATDVCIPLEETASGSSDKTRGSLEQVP